MVGKRVNLRSYGYAGRGIVLLVALATVASSAGADLYAPPLSTAEIVQRLLVANTRRANALRAYRGKRTYHLAYRGLFGSHDAQMEVEATYNAPDQKNFRIISESGSKLLINRVLMRLLSSESDAQREENRKAQEVNPANYDFSLQGTEHTDAGDFYVLGVQPKGKNRYLYHGKIWVDANDFAIARMQGEPQKNPSIWSSHTEIAYQWAKKDGFWLPVRNESVTQVRMGGKATLTIDYSDYQITGVDRSAAKLSSNRSEALPDPASVTADPH